MGLAGFVLMYIPESTIFLLENGRFDVVRKDIDYLLKFNKASEEAKQVTYSLLDRLETKKKSILEINLEKMKAHQLKNEPSMLLKLLSDHLIVYNLLMMILVWFSSSFTFYLLNFLVKYMPGDIYFNSVISGLSAFAMLFEGKLQDWMGMRGAMMASFAVTVVSTIWLCFFEKGTTAVLVYAFVLFLAKSGSSLTFGYAYAIHIELFPSNFIITSYGICNVVCRGLTIFAPFVAEVPNPWVPLIFLNGSSIAGLVASMLLKKRPDEKPALTPDPGHGKEEEL